MKALDAQRWILVQYDELLPSIEYDHTLGILTAHRGHIFFERRFEDTRANREFL